MAGMRATFGQDVDPDVFEHQPPLAQVELQILGKIGHMGVELLHDFGEDRKAPGQVGQRGVGGIAGIAVLLAPVLPGRVVSVRAYGAFVDLGGGIQGLLHVSEMGWSRVSDPGTIVQPGDEITVKVLRIDDEKGKISLGLKQLQADPWTKVAQTYAAGQVLTGKMMLLK